MDIANLEKQKNIFVVDNVYHSLILSFKNAHPDLFIQIINKIEVLKDLSFTYSSNAINLLIKNGYSYQKAQYFLSVLPYARYLDYPLLNDIYNLLDKNKCIIYNPYGLQRYKNKKIYIIENEFDDELHQLFIRKNIEISDLSLLDLGIKPNNELTALPYLEFKDKVHQYLYIFSDIRKKLLLDPNKDITIVIKDEGDMFYIFTYSSIFSVPYYRLDKLTLSSIGIIKEYMKTIYEEKSYNSVPSESDDIYVKSLINIINEYQLNQLDDFNYSYHNLLEILDDISVNQDNEKLGIKITTDFIINPRSDVYVTNFEHGVFYKTAKDDKYINDKIYESFKHDGDKYFWVNPSYINALVDQQKKRNYLKYGTFSVISRVLRHLSDKIYDADILDEICVNGIKKKDIVRYIDFNNDGVYTSIASSIIHSIQYDLVFDHGKHDEINSYDHSYHHISNTEDLFKNNSYHVTNLETYISCPFKYYLNKLIPNKLDDYSYMSRGIFIHKIMEDIFSPTFDFVESFKKAKEAYIRYYEKQDIDVPKKDLANLEIYHHYLKTLIPILRNNIRTNITDIEKTLHEQNVSFSLIDEKTNQTYYFKGQIDCVIFSKNSNGNKYYSIVDFKTGNESFNLKEIILGKSVQLPIYYYALNADNNKSLIDEYEFGGFYINHVYCNGYADITNIKGTISEQSIKSAMRFVGLALKEDNYLNSVDKNIFTKAGTIKSTGGDLIKYDYYIENDEIIIDKEQIGYTLFDLTKDTKEALINIINLIKDNQFPIAPSKRHDLDKQIAKDHKDLNCQYCPYSNVCYVNKRIDSVDYSNKVKQHFEQKKKEYKEKQSKENNDGSINI